MDTDKVEWGLRMVHDEEMLYSKNILLGRYCTREKDEWARKRPEKLYTRVVLHNSQIPEPRSNQAHPIFKSLVVVLSCPVTSGLNKLFTWLALCLYRYRSWRIIAPFLFPLSHHHRPIHPSSTQSLTGGRMMEFILKPFQFNMMSIHR